MTISTTFGRVAGLLASEAHVDRFATARRAALTAFGARAVPRWTLVSSALSPLLLVVGWLAADALQPPSYSPMRQTVSVLAGHGGHDRWVMTAALFAVGACHLVSATGLSRLRWSARAVLALAGVAAIGVATHPEPVDGSTVPHLVWTSVGAVAIAIWPAFVGERDGPPSRSFALSVRGSAWVTAAFVVLLAWLASATQVGGELGLAERLTSGIQTCWPFVVAVALRRAWAEADAGYADAER